MLPNGDLEVLFNNGNTPTVNNQQLAVHCHPAGDSNTGTAHLNCTPPTLVGDDVLLGAPTCNFGRFCIPGHYIRTNDYPRIGVNTDNGHLYSVWQDYRNGEWDIQMVHSYDGGVSWVNDGTVNPDSGLDHYFPAVDVGEGNVDRVGVSYYAGGDPDVRTGGERDLHGRLHPQRRTELVGAVRFQGDRTAVLTAGRNSGGLQRRLQQPGDYEGEPRSPDLVGHA